MLLILAEVGSIVRRKLRRDYFFLAKGLVVGFDELHLDVILMVLFTSDGLAAIADLAEGVIEVAAVEAQPISAGISLGGMVAVGFLHGRG